MCTRAHEPGSPVVPFPHGLTYARLPPEVRAFAEKRPPRWTGGSGQTATRSAAHCPAFDRISSASLNRARRILS